MVARGRGAGRGRREGPGKTAARSTTSGEQAADQGERSAAANQEAGDEALVDAPNISEAELLEGDSEEGDEVPVGEDCGEGFEEFEENELEGEAEGMEATGEMERGEFEDMEELFEAGDEEYYGDAGDEDCLDTEQFAEGSAGDGEPEEPNEDFAEPEEEEEEDFQQELCDFGEVIDEAGGDSEGEQATEDFEMEEQAEEKDKTADDAGTDISLAEESRNVTQAEESKGEMDEDADQEHLASEEKEEADEEQSGAPAASGGQQDEGDESEEKRKKKDSEMKEVKDTKTKTVAEQDEEKQKKMELLQLSRTKNRVCIPLVYLGPIFDKYSFNYRVRIRPVVLHDFRDGGGITKITANADSVRILYEHPYKVMELFVTGGRIGRLMEKVLYNTFNSNFMTFEVERRRATKFAKEEGRGDKNRLQPIEYAELINRVTFRQKNAYTRRFLQDTDGWIGKSVKQRSLFLHNLPPSMDENFLKILFPRSLKVGLVKVSDDIRSAVLQMKDKNMAYHHLIAYTDFYVDGRDVQMGTVDMSQQDALAKYEMTSPGQVPKSTPKKEAWLQRQRATATSATEAQRKELKKAFDSLVESAGSEKSEEQEKKDPERAAKEGERSEPQEQEKKDKGEKEGEKPEDKEPGLEEQEKKEKGEKEREKPENKQPGLDEQEKKDEEKEETEKKECKTPELEKDGGKDGDRKEGKTLDLKEQEKKDKERKEREKKEREKREHERREREKKDRERREREQRERERQRQKVREEREQQKMEESKKKKEDETKQERERERKRKERAQEERLRKQERARREEQQAREKQRRMHEEQRELERQRELAWQREAEIQRELLLQRELEMQREVQMRRELELQREMELQRELEKQRELERLRLEQLQELERQKRQQQEKELQKQLVLQEQERQRLAREEAALKLQQMEEQHRRERQREEEQERQRKQERERQRMREQQERKRKEAVRREQPAQKRSRFSSPHAERQAPGHFGPATTKQLQAGKVSYDSSFDHDDRGFQSSNHQRLGGRDAAMQEGNYMFDERNTDGVLGRSSWFDRNQAADQPRMPRPDQERQAEEEFQGRPAQQFRNPSYPRGRGTARGMNQRSPGRSSATVTSGQGLLAEPANPQSFSLQESLQLEVAKQAEELKRNLALLEEFHKDPGRAVVSLAKVDPSLASIGSAGPREGMGRRGHAQATPVMGPQGSREVERKEARQNQQPYNRNLSTPHSFRQNRSRSGGQGQDYESVFQDYEKELTQQGRPSQPMQEFQQQQQQQHRAVHSDRLSFGKGRSERSSFGRAGHVADPSFGRDQYDGEQSGGDWQMRRDYSQQPGLLGDPPATFDRGDYFGSSGQQQGQFNRLGVEEKAQLQMVALRQQEQERLLVEEQVQYTAPGDGAGMRMEERNMAGGAGFQRRQTADYEYQGGRSVGARGNRRDYY